MNSSPSKKKDKKVVEYDDAYYDEDEDMEGNVEEVGHSRKKHGEGLEIKKNKDSTSMKTLRTP